MPQLLLALRCQDSSKAQIMQDLTNPRLNSKPYPSIALNIANKVLQDKNGLVQAIQLEFTDEEIEALN